MGEQDVQGRLSGEQRRSISQAILDDLGALEHMLEKGMVERDRRRIGAEQELFLIDENWRPAPVAPGVLETLQDPHFTTELARFNLEANLDPIDFRGQCFRELEEQLNTLLAKARTAAAAHDSKILLTGILPTIAMSDLGLENMTPNPRYFALNDALTALRGSSYEFRIRGVDELMVKHDSVMVESCNASFQAHLQVDPEQFPLYYNVAQAVAAPILAAVTNSPLLFGRRLWAETRIALFEQAVDTRATQESLRESAPRVWFGRDYVHKGITEIYKEDITRFRALLAAEKSEDPFELLRRGEAPALRALSVHNSTVYRWNRGCYGRTEGKPHLRIENRILPSGPTAQDEVANSAFWFGLMEGMVGRYEDVTERLPFEYANANFHAAAQLGLSAEFTWFDGEHIVARDLLLERLLPIAREGLERQEVDSRDADRYLDIIAQRVEKRQTGAHWLVQSWEATKGKGTTNERLSALTAAMVNRQHLGRPVHEWSLAAFDEAGDWRRSFQRVEHFMTTDLYTVQEDELIDLVANLMDWNRIRHVLVEDGQQHLVGLVSYRSLLRALSKRARANPEPLSVSDIMTRNPITVDPDTPTLDVINLMRQHKVACVPVVRGDKLVGVVTERDFMDITAELVQEKLRD